jgi:hypothetical protein
MPLIAANAAASTAGNWSTSVPVNIETEETMREFVFVLDPSTDAPVSISFDGKNEHLRLIPTDLPSLRWKATARKFWVLKSNTGTVWVVLVMANNEVV